MGTPEDPLRRVRPQIAAMHIDLPDLVQALRDILGTKLVAYIGDVQETKSVKHWVEGTSRPSPAVENRLRRAYQIAQILRERHAALVVQAWFQGMNPLLDDQAPARVLRESESEADDSDGLVLVAARTFSSASPR